MKRCLTTVSLLPVACLLVAPAGCSLPPRALRSVDPAPVNAGADPSLRAQRSEAASPSTAGSFALRTSSVSDNTVQPVNHEQTLLTETDLLQTQAVADFPVADPAPRPTLEPVSIGATSDGLTLEDLESRVVANHPAIAAAQARVAAVRGDWIQAGLPPNPSLQYTSEEIGAGDASGLHSVMIGPTIVTANKLQLQQRIQESRLRQAEAELESTRYRVLTDLRVSFVAALVAQHRVRLMSRLRDIAQQSVQAVEAMAAADELSRIELLQAQTELERATLNLETAQASLDGQRRQLETVTAAGPLGPEPIVGDWEDTFDVISWESIRDEILRSSPELASRWAEIEQARRDLTLTAAQIVPNVNVLAGAGYDAGSDDTFAAIQVTVPLPVINRNQGALRRGRAQLAEASSRLRQKELDLANRIAANVQAYETARLQYQRIQNEIVPRAEETLQLTTQAFQAGETSYLQLLTAQRTLFEARLSGLEARRNATQAAARLDGKLLEGALLDP